VTGAAMMRAWHEVSAAGFEMSMEAVQPYHDAYAFNGFEGSFDGAAAQTHRHYLGFVAGEPVTSATLILAAGVAGVYDVSTPPRWQRRGYGAAITALTLAEARAAGYRYACLTASPQGERVYRRLGFHHHFRPVEYRWQRPAGG
jgi:GNAT superfamily N-acetyltransferase